ncbi:hypothetical protein RJT34_05997 [Clitoria ternatea]|uniref:Leucine-rich repeat-containing N-terminal plant-type domain-containing protein n=1 Tax=Clitoria ternatea TaxID=43366 RepID=A0AAN9PU21_CLITE
METLSAGSLRFRVSGTVLVLNAGNKMFVGVPSQSLKVHLLQQKLTNKLKAHKFTVPESNLKSQLHSPGILALMEFKKGIKHDPTCYVLNSWNEESIDFDGCPSSWNGVMSNGGNVAGVVLENLGLSAETNSSVFSVLTKLVKLSMSNNSISGKLPENIAEFKSLEFLDVSNNLFSSSLPKGIGKLTSSQNLSLVGNNFSGSIPDYFRNGFNPIFGLEPKFIFWDTASIIDKTDQPGVT